MNWQNLELITFFLAVLVLAPLTVSFPVYVVWFWRRRREAKRRRVKVRFSVAVVVFYAVFLFTFVLIPNLIRFQYRCGCGGVKTDLGALFTLETAYFGEYDTFAGRSGINGSGAIKDIGWESLNASRYTYYVGGDYLSPGPPEEKPEYQPDRNWPCTIRPEAGAHGFTIMAIGNIDDDPCPDVWMMNDAKHLKQLVDDKKDWVLDEACLGCPGAKKPSAALKKWEKLNDNINFQMQKRFIMGAFPVWFSLAAILAWLLLRERRKWGEAQRI